jgi:4-hydroxyproline epimerase
MNQRVRIIDSHTGGEPTRVVVDGGPDLGGGSAAAQLKVFREQHDRFRSAVVNEPRGSDVLVGALLVPPADRMSMAGVIFFNNVGYLGMCGHGTIGVVATLAHLGRIRPGDHRLETSVGVVTARLHVNGEVSVVNVPSYRKARQVQVSLRGLGGSAGPPDFPEFVTGDVAWGGNWFFLCDDHGQELDLQHVQRLTELTQCIRQAVHRQGYPEVDHVELVGPSRTDGAHARNFVLCPGGAYDRSPCGTGTSAKLACLAAEGKLAEGEVWIQESILGSRFTGTYRWDGEQVIPTITGAAYVNAEATLLLQSADPFCWGIR